MVRVYLEKTTILNDTCTLVFAATLLTTARTWKQAGCPSTDELECIQTMSNYSAIKKKEFESVLVRWMNLEPNIQSEVGQKEKSKYY